MRELARWIIAGIFLFTSLGPESSARAAELFLPAPGSMVPLSEAFSPPVLKGIKVSPADPLRLDFIVDKGDYALDDASLKDESSRLVKYFLASLTTPETDLWVNLNPYEKNRIIPDAFGLTEMGRDLLAQDYLLKQITSSILYPEGETGKKFWKQVYAKVYEKYGTTDIPMDTFNRVWIMPESVDIYENSEAGAAYIVRSHLKVMLESDYAALGKNAASDAGAQSLNPVDDQQQTGEISKQVMRGIIIPELEREVNEGKGFLRLRQVYQSLILAAWYKKKVKSSLLAAVYVDRNKTSGINIDDPKEAEKIWAQYVEAFKKGAFNYVKEETDAFTQELIPRKYFSGGFDGKNIDHAMRTVSFEPSFSAGLYTAAVNMDAAQAGNRWKNSDRFQEKKALTLNKIIVRLVAAAIVIGVTAAVWKYQDVREPIYEKVGLKQESFIHLSNADGQIPVKIYTKKQLSGRAFTLPGHLFKAIKAIYFLSPKDYGSVVEDDDPQEQGYYNLYTGEIAMRDAQRAWNSLSHEVMHHYWKTVLDPETKKKFEEIYTWHKDVFTLISDYSKTSNSAEEAFCEMARAWVEDPVRVSEVYHKKSAVWPFIAEVVKAFSRNGTGIENNSVRVYLPLGSEKPYEDVPYEKSNEILQQSKEVQASLELQRIQRLINRLIRYIDQHISSAGEIATKYEDVPGKNIVKVTLGKSFTKVTLVEFLKRHYGEKPPEGFTWKTLVKEIERLNQGFKGNFSEPEPGAVFFLPGDKAQAVGGIDLNPNALTMNVQNSGRDIQVNVDPAMLQRFSESDGIIPVIIGLQPLSDVAVFLGVPKVSS